MVDPETFSSITRTFLRIKSEEADEMIKFMERMKKLEKQTEEQID